MSSLNSEITKLKSTYEKKKKLALKIFIILIIIEIILGVIYYILEEFMILIFAVILIPIMIAFLIIGLINPEKLAKKTIDKKKKIKLKNVEKSLKEKIKVLSTIDEEIKAMKYRKNRLERSKVEKNIETNHEDESKKITNIKINDKKIENKKKIVSKRNDKTIKDVNRIELQRQIARTLQKKEGYFTIQRILEKLDDNSSLSPDEKTEILDEIKRWLAQDPLIKKLGEFDGINRYVFI